MLICFEKKKKKVSVLFAHEVLFRDIMSRTFCGKIRMHSQKSVAANLLSQPSPSTHTHTLWLRNEALPTVIQGERENVSGRLTGERWATLLPCNPAGSVD